MAGSKSRAGTRYTPGSWISVVRSGTVVLLRPDAAPGLVESLWELLATGPEVHEVLDAVTSASGGSLARLPWFGIVDVRDAMQVFLRGEIDLEVRHAGGDVALSGRDVTTWTERRFAAPERFSLSIPGATGGAAPTGPAHELPLADGVVLLQGLSASFAGQSGPAKSAEVQSTGVLSEPVAAADPAVEAEVLAAAEADIAADDAAELGDDDVSAETMVELPEDDLDDAGAGTESPPETPLDPGPELTGNYDHLWEQTVMRSIEDAAVREDPDADPEPATGPSTPEEARDDADAPAPDVAPEPAPDEAPADAPGATPAAPVAAAVPSGLIDSVPWHTGGDGQSAAWPAPAPLPTPAPAPAPQRGTPLPPSFSQRPDTAPAPAAPSEPDADHDGQTIMKGDLAARPARTGTAGAGTAADPGTGPMVLARVCPQGHANPSTYAQCGRCGVALPGDGVQVRRPRLGRVRLSTGELLDLDQSLVVGRQPSVSRVQGAVMPRLVQVASPSGDISRSHVEVRLEGWHVMLCDLKATNGTVLVRDGQAPRRLAQGEMAILLDGDIAELGDGISLRFEEIP